MRHIEKMISDLCPKGVPTYSLGEIGSTVSGLRGKSKTDFTDGNAPYVSYVEIFNNPGLDFVPEKRVQVDASENQSSIHLGDVLVTGSSETRNECGMTSVVTTEPSLPVYVNSFCFIWRPNEGVALDPQFAKHLFRGRAFRDRVIETANGVTRQNISKPKFLAIKIPLPPIEVQHEIALILNKFTAQESELETALQAELEDRKVQRSFILSEFHRGNLPKQKGSRLVALKDIVHFENGKPHESLVDPTGDCKLITSKFISTNGVQARRINYSKIRTPAFVDDVTIVLSDLPNGRALAKCYLVRENDKFAVNQRIAILRSTNVDVADPEYVFHYVNRNHQILRHDNGSTQTHLKQADVVDIKIHLPDIQTQKAIARKLTFLENLVTEISESIPGEIHKRRQQFDFYRTALLSFKELEIA
jgi:type I restriction enzyme S subunit